MSDPMADFVRQQGDELRAVKRELRAKDEQLATFITRDAITDAMADAGPDADKDHLPAFLRGSNLRVVDGRAIVDVVGITTTPKEAVAVMQTMPDKFGNLFYVAKPPEPTPQELHNSKLRKMSNEQFNAYRRRRGPDYMTPESD